MKRIARALLIASLAATGSAAAAGTSLYANIADELAAISVRETSATPSTYSGTRSSRCFNADHSIRNPASLPRNRSVTPDSHTAIHPQSANHAVEQR